VPTNNTGTVSVSVLSADLSLVKTASTGAVSVGGTLTYSLVISNAGAEHGHGCQLRRHPAHGPGHGHQCGQRGQRQRQHGQLRGHAHRP
jgi:hypothetical protein